MASVPPPGTGTYGSSYGDFASGAPPDEFSSGPAYSPGRRGTGCRGCLFVTCGCLVASVVVGIGAIIIIGWKFGPQIQEYFAKWAKDLPAYQEGVQRVTGSQRVKERLGDKIQASLPTQFNYRKTPAGTHAVVSFTVAGQKGTAVVTSMAMERQGKWKLQQLWIAYEDGTGEDLLKTEPP